MSGAEIPAKAPPRHAISDVALDSPRLAGQ